MLRVVHLFTQLASVGAFCGSVIFFETWNARVWSVTPEESFAAVGQWGNLAVLLLVLIAAGVGRIWAIGGEATGTGDVEMGCCGCV